MNRRKTVLGAALAGAVIGALAVRFRTQPFAEMDWPKVACILVFVLFTIYWTLAATHAPSKSAESIASRRVHEILLNGAYLLLLLPLIFSSRIPFLNARFVPQQQWIAVLGLTLQAASFALAVWARRNLGQNWSGRIEIKFDHELVRSGPYRILRHPIYTAVLGIVVGMALTIGKVHALLGVVIIAGAYLRKIRLEEAKLRSAFGVEYEKYRRETWGFVPGVF